MTLFQTIQEVEESLERNNNISQPAPDKNKGTATARIFNNDYQADIPEDAALDHAAGPHIAKVYSDYTLDHIDRGLDELDEDGLPVTSNSTQYIARGRGGSDQGAFVTQSDWTLHKKPLKNVGRSQSNVEKNRVIGKLVPSSSKAKDNQAPGMAVGLGGGRFMMGNRYGGQGVYLRSPSDAQLFAYKREQKKMELPKPKQTKYSSDPTHQDIIRPANMRAVNVDKHQVPQISSATFVAPAKDIRAAEASLDRKHRKPRRVAPKPPPISGPRSKPVVIGAPAPAPVAASDLVIARAPTPEIVEAPATTTQEPEPVVARIKSSSVLDNSIPAIIVNKPPSEVRNNFIDSSIRIPSTVRSKPPSVIDIGLEASTSNPPSQLSSPPVVMRPKSSSQIAESSSHLRHSNPPDDPTALYAIVSKVKESITLSPIGSHLSSTEEEPQIEPASPPASPVPPPPPPPPLPSPPPGNPQQPAAAPSPDILMPPLPPLTSPGIPLPPLPTTPTLSTNQLVVEAVVENGGGLQEADKPGQEEIDAAVVAEEENERQRLRHRQKSIASGEFALSGG